MVWMAVIFFSAAVCEADGEHEIVVVGGFRFGIIDGFVDPLRQEFPPADDVHTDVVVVNALVVGNVLETSAWSNLARLALRTVEVLGGQGVDGEPRNLEFQHPVQHRSSFSFQCDGPVRWRCCCRTVDSRP